LRSMRDSLSSMLIHAGFQDRHTDASAYFTFGRVPPRESPQTRNVPLSTVHAACSVVVSAIFRMQPFEIVSLPM